MLTGKMLTISTASILLPLVLGGGPAPVLDRPDLTRDEQLIELGNISMGKNAF